MRKTLERAIAALIVTSLGALVGSAQAADFSKRAGSQQEQANGSTIVIPADAKFPMTKQVGMGAGKSLMIQFPAPLKDVLVADPMRMDAVVQSSNQVFLIAKQPGATNAFFFDQNGQQILTLEVAIGADLSGLEQLLRRLIPGSNISIDTAGKAVVLTGTARTPVDSSRATDIAREFVKASKGQIAAYGGVPGATPNGQVGGLSLSLNGSSARGGATSDDTSDKPVINMISVEGEEQVMLKVHVAEVNRQVLKQFGINLGASINAGSLSTSILTDNALPLTSAAGLGKLAVAGIGTTAAGAGCAASGALCMYNAGPSSRLSEAPE